jgi:uncharacterized protein
MRARRRGGAALLAGSVVAGLALVPMVAAPAAAVPGNDSTVWINEFHYDNASFDSGEFIEIAGPSCTDLTGWKIVRYNGSTATAAVVYPVGTEVALAGIVPDQQGGYGTVVVDFPQDGVQNGPNDGFALVNGSTVVQLLSYEGAFTASNGAATGLTATNLPVSQAGNEPVGSSLQLTGSGTTYGDFTWVETEGSNTKGLPNAGQTFEGVPPEGGCPDPEPLDCDEPATFIHEIQGAGPTSPLEDEEHAVQGVVTTTERGLNGYYVQEEPEDHDADPETSEGIFVFVGPGNEIPVATGQQVRVLGRVGEFTGTGSSQTQITNSQAVVCGGSAPDIDPVPVTFPVPSTTYLERYEGMLVELADTLVISEYFNYDRFGEVVLAKPLDGQDRLHTPTAVVDPGAPAQELAAEQALRIITLDDKFGGQNPSVIPHPGNGAEFSLQNRFRGGDTVTGVQGVIDHTFGLYRIQPTAYGEYEVTNPRPLDPPDVGGSLEVASFNVLNYFLTIDRGGQPNWICGPDQDQECRGADTEEELERQRTKILAALAALDADVVGLMEMENTPGVEPAADLADGLNDILGAGTYDYIDTGVIGTDAIRLGFLYKPDTVRPAGGTAVLNSEVDSRFVDTLNRPMLTQTFDELATGARVTVSVNHLKSKGSDCDDFDDPDTGDGQGNCNLTRTAAAEAIVDFLAADPTNSGDPDHLVIGDLNSYDHEDPIKVFERESFTDLIKKFGGEFAYSFVFDARVGYLDHALSNPSLTPQVTGAAEWHINADEPDILDYDMTFKPPEIDALFELNAFRSSDHDPVLVGLDLISVDRCYADDAQSVDSYAPGRRVNGTAVPPAFRDASQALGLSDPDQSDPYWVSLGLGGEVVLEFDSVVFNNNGSAPDLRVVDVDDGAKGRSDAAVVHASADGQTWVELGRVVGTGEVDLGALETARYVKVIDDTTGDLRPATDGYDLDAVEVLTGCA